MATAGNITAVLTLNSSGFQTGLDNAINSLTNFKTNANSLNSTISNLSKVLQTLENELVLNFDSLTRINQMLANNKNFVSFANAVNNIAKALKTLSSDAVNVETGMNVINNILKQLQSVAGNSTIKVQGLARALKELNASESSSVSSTTNLKNAFNSSYMSADKFGQSLRNARLEEERQKQNLEMLTREFNRLALGIEQFNAVQTSSVSSTQQWTSAQAHSGRSAREVAEEIRQNLNAKRQEISTNSQLVGSESQVASAETKQAVATDKATNSIRKQETATKSLNKAFSSLRMMGTMVGSMIAYNFVHNLAMATTETINAKSEMNGYFQMLGYTTSQTQRFNKALEETVQKFPRLNKYALGETISSIGVEFELTTKEMEKAMPVVSMITSEYLRAGRNVNEASLAVKDILQGEFQRLSRETGVKQDTLKEAGWSGDKNDVMGLLEALDKVGKARHWDTFVQKANSLNDAVLIVQNRFSEWSADMVERIQPAILEVFNTLLIVAQDFAKGINSALDWLSGDGIGQSIVKWGGLATAIGGVVTALAVYRTGANLTQLTKMGLLRTIGATILGLEAETVAEYGLRTSLIANITHMEAEEVARQGRLNSILATITGLKAEEVAEMGKTKALFSAILGLDMATVKEYGFTTALWSNITGVEAETIAMEGWNAQMVLAVAELGVMVSALAVFTGAMIYQTVVISQTTEKYKKFVNMVDKGDDIINEAKSSYDTLSEKKQKLTEKLATLTEGTYEYNKVANKLKVTNDDLTTATHNYEDAVNSVAWAKHKQELYDEEKASAQAEAQRDINEALLDYGMNVKDAQQLSNQYWNDAINGWDQHYETLQKVNLQYKKNAISVENSLKKLNDVKLDDKEVNVLIRNKISAGNQVANAKEELGNATGLAEYVDKWLWLQVAQLNNAIADFNINEASQGMGEAISGLAWGLVHALGDNFFGQFGKNLAKDMGLAGKGKGLGDSLKQPINDFIEYILENGFTLDIGSFAINMRTRLTEWFNSLDILGTISDIFSGLFNGDGKSGGGNSSKGMKKIDPSILFGSIDFAGITKWFDDNLKKPVLDAWNSFISFDWLPSIDFNIGSLLSGFFGSGESSDDPNAIDPVATYINNNIVTPLTNFASDPIGTISSWGLALPQINLGTLIQGLFNIGGDGGFDIGGWLASIFNIDTIVSTFTSNLQVIFTTASTIASNVGNVFSNLKSMIWGHIQGILTNVTTTFTNIKNTATTQINGLASGIQGGIDKVKNAFIYMKDSILNSAKAIYDGVKQKFDSVKNTIGDFWNNLTNPSSWGSAGSESYQRRSPKPQTARRMFSPVIRSATHHGAGVNPYQNDSQTVKLKDLMDMVNGDNKVRLSDFLSMFSEGGFGTWDFHEPVKKKVFDTAKDYKTGSPNIQGIGTVGDGYKVGKFWDGKPSFTFQEFQSVAQAIFSAIPYKFYYDSEWKGSWVNALLSGAVNCSDGADALIALANVFGFSGYKQHTTLKSGVGHFFAVIGGKPMDTTNFQNHGSWSPLGGAGIPTRTANPRGYAGETQGKTVNITVSMDGATVYGIDDLDSRIQESVQKGLQEEFNDPYTVAI